MSPVKRVRVVAGDQPDGLDHNDNNSDSSAINTHCAEGVRSGAEPNKKGRQPGSRAALQKALLGLGTMSLPQPASPPAGLLLEGIVLKSSMGR